MIDEDSTRPDQDVVSEPAYSSIEEEPIDEDPVHDAQTDLPEPVQAQSVDPAVEDELAAALAAARARRERAELGPDLAND